MRGAVNRKRIIWLILAVLAAVIIFAAFKLNQPAETRYFTAPTDRGDIRQVVQATGTINAVITVQVGSQVSGTIAKLFADFNSHVKKGQVIAQIDPAIFEGNLLQAKADMGNSDSALKDVQAMLKGRHYSDARPGLW